MSHPVCQGLFKPPLVREGISAFSNEIYEDRISFRSFGVILQLFPLLRHGL